MNIDVEKTDFNFARRVFKAMPNSDVLISSIDSPILLVQTIQI